MRRALAGALALATVLSAFAAFGIVGRVGANADPGSAVEIAQEFVVRNWRAFGLSASDVGDVVVSSEVVSRHTGVTHVYLQQVYGGIEVYGGILNVNVRPDGTILSAGSGFVSNLATAAAGQRVATSAVEAAAAATAHLDLAPTESFGLLAEEGGPSMASEVSDGGVARAPIPAELVWFPVGGSVRLAWSLEIDEASGDHWWQAFVDAETGEALGAEDRIAHDTADAITAAIGRPGSGAVTAPEFAPTDGAEYNVFPIPMESPSDGGRELVANAADPDASPFGWHDTNGAPGPEFPITRGNNVHAYADRDSNNVPDPGSSPDGGPSLSFDFPLDLSLRPLDSQPAIVTNLFYWNNVVHDVWHGYGFDEAAGNFQVNNYGHGGLGGDDVRAEAQDGSGKNNANFGTPVDGLRPRMQMFEWRSSVPNPIEVLPPSQIAGTYYGPMAGFGESLVTTGPITAEVVYVDDGFVGSGTVHDGCEPFGGVSEKIALIDRGLCTFVTKVKNAQNAGALAVIVVNNVAGFPIAMGGSDPTIVIPSVMVSLADGDLFKPNLPFSVRISDGTGGAPDRDSDLDAGVIAHEYGHGVSNRLTGGPATVACLNNAEQMGEGWSDYMALVLTTHPTDTRAVARGIGTYVTYQPADGAGIRPTPYATDLAVNPSTYADVADALNISQPHGIGYVWATMLWEVYWNLVDRHGYNPDVYADWTTGGNNLAIQLVMDGMKYQPCRPGFVDGRNAILTADLALTGGENACEIWRGFAKRGLGYSASQGSSLSRLDGAEAFDLPPTCTSAHFGGFGAPIRGPPAVNTVHAGAVVPVRFTLSNASYLIIDSQPVDCDTLVPTGAAPEPIDTPGSTGMMHRGDAYFLFWETDPSWSGTCRRLTLRIPAAEDAVAYFRFT